MGSACDEQLFVQGDTVPVLLDVPTIHPRPPRIVDAYKRFRHAAPSSGATLQPHRSASAGSPCRRSYTFTGCGAFQAPLSASGLGQYSRSTSANGPFGVGSQLDSLSMPGDSFWM